MTRGSPIDPIIHVKDGLRRLRYRIRHVAPGEGEPPSALPPLPTPLAVVADSMFSFVEAAREALGPDTESSHRSRGALPINDYVALATGSGMGSRAFASVAYHAYKNATLRLGAREALISEAALDGARRSFADSVSLGIEGAAAADLSREISDCAALAVAFARARPIRRIDFDLQRSTQGGHFADDPNVFVAFVIALSAYVAQDPTRREVNDPLLVAEAAVDTYFQSLKDALFAPEPVAAATAALNSIVSYL